MDDKQEFLLALSKHWKDILANTKDYAYAAMMPHKTKDAALGEADRNYAQLTYAINNKDAIVKNRNNIDRNLASLYIYGNDLGLFEEAPELKNLGVDYINYLKSIGRDPNDIITYKGNIPGEIILPEETQENIVDFINSSRNKTLGADADLYPEYGMDTDDVAGFLQHLSLDANGNPIVVNSDLWDFEPKSYTRKWGLNYLKALALDKVGIPFILKDTQPITYVPLEDFYDMYLHLPESSRNIARQFGYGEPIEVSYDVPTKTIDVYGLDK